jgi:RNA polymerase sigma-B factor
LFRCWTECGDRRARDELVERFLPLARSLARRYLRSSEPQDDLVQVASLGLVKAVERFEPGRGIAFPAFAVPTILGELKRYFRDAGWAVHVPRSAQERAGKISNAQAELTARNGRSPTVRELSRHVGLSEEEVLDGLQAAEAYDATSLEAPQASEDGGSTSYLDSIGADDERIERADEAVTVLTAVKGLPPREREIIYLRFVEDLTQTEIAERIGISQMQISRVLRSSVRRLRELTDDSGEADEEPVAGDVSGAR